MKGREGTKSTTVYTEGVGKISGNPLPEGIFYFMFSLKKNLNLTIRLCEFRINRRYHTRFTGQQCSQKWRNLLRDYNVSKKNKHNFI